MQLPESYILHPTIADAARHNTPVVALESTLITHGFEYPDNLNVARELEEEIRKHDVVAATIALLDGVFHVGLSGDELERIAAPGSNPEKISSRNLGIASVLGQCGGTTVAATLVVAHRAGLRVFATGGIGGVHREDPCDVSADLVELSRRPVVVVCAGAKSILDLSATLERLETYGVPVLGFGTQEFPAFYSAESGLPVDCTITSPEEVARIACRHWESGSSSSVLVVVPPPAEDALDREELEKLIQKASALAKASSISRSRLTPFLLAKLRELSDGKTKKVNISLLRNNARVAALISTELQKLYVL